MFLQLSPLLPQTLSGPDRGLVRFAPSPDDRVRGVAALLHDCSCIAVEPRRSHLRSVASLCLADKGGCARRAVVLSWCCTLLLEGHLQEQCGPSPGARAHGLSHLRTSVSQHSRADHHPARPTSCCAAPAPVSGQAVLLRLPAPTVVAASAPASHPAPSPAVWWTAPAPVVNFTHQLQQCTLHRVFGWPHRSCASGMPRRGSACNGVASAPLVVLIVDNLDPAAASQSSKPAACLVS